MDILILHDLITIQIIILCNVFLNWNYLEGSRLFLFRNSEIMKRALRAYIGIMFIEELLIYMEKLILSNFINEEKVYIFISVFHSFLYFLSNSMYMNTFYSAISGLIIFGFLTLKVKFDFLTGIIVHIFYKFVNLFMLHTIANYS